jgi:hypothetical protein
MWSIGSVKTDSSKQILVSFLRDLNQYFEIKAVPESFKLPLAARELTSYDFRTKLSNLLWNEIKESGHFSVFQDLLEGGMEKMQGHFLQYAGLAAKLLPNLKRTGLNQRPDTSLSRRHTESNVKQKF